MVFTIKDVFKIVAIEGGNMLATISLSDLRLPTLQGTELIHFKPEIQLIPCSEKTLCFFVKIFQQGTSGQDYYIKTIESTQQINSQVQIQEEKINKILITTKISAVTKNINEATRFTPLLLKDLYSDFQEIYSLSKSPVDLAPYKGENSISQFSLQNAFNNPTLNYIFVLALTEDLENGKFPSRDNTNILSSSLKSHPIRDLVSKNGGFFSYPKNIIKKKDLFGVKSISPQGLTNQYIDNTYWFSPRNANFNALFPIQPRSLNR